jgi:hypothetical protein
MTKKSLEVTIYFVFLFFEKHYSRTAKILPKEALV